MRVKFGFSTGEDEDDEVDHPIPARVRDWSDEPEMAQGGRKASEILSRPEKLCLEDCLNAARKLDAMRKLLHFRNLWQKWDCDNVLGGEHSIALGETHAAFQNLGKVLKLCKDRGL